MSSRTSVPRSALPATWRGSSSDVNEDSAAYSNPSVRCAACQIVTPFGAQTRDALLASPRWPIKQSMRSLAAHSQVNDTKVGLLLGNNECYDHSRTNKR